MSGTPMSGRVSRVTIKSENNSNNIRVAENAKLEYLRSGSNIKVAVKVPPDYMDMYQFDLNDASYVERSSTPGVVECIHVKSKGDTLIIMDKNKQCVELLNHIRKRLTDTNLNENEPPKRHRGPAADIEEDRPVATEKVNRLIRALRDGNGDEASQLVSQLASQKSHIRFDLDMINESGNAAPAPPPAPPVVEPLKVKLTIESFIMNTGNPQTFDVDILPETTIQDLKALVRESTEIDPNQQYWYIEREHLPDTYRFGVTQPRIKNDTILTLYIAKSQNY